MTPSLRFDVWNSFREREEGGYSDDPSDAGGETKYGISKRAHPELDIPNLTREQANEIAYADYWVPVGGDELPWPVSLVMADFAFHSGASRARRELAHELDIDGDTGASLVIIVAKRRAEKVGAQRLAEGVHLRRVSFLARLIQGNASQVKFAGGWFARCVRLAFLFGG